MGKAAPLGRREDASETNAVNHNRKLLPDHNRRFTKPPGNLNDAHRPLGPRQNVAAILSIQESRFVGNDYTIGPTIGSIRCTSPRCLVSVRDGWSWKSGWTAAWRSGSVSTT